MAQSSQPEAKAAAISAAVDLYVAKCTDVVKA